MCAVVPDAAQSHQRRFSRWLHNSRINVQRLYSPLIAAALVNWGVSSITLIEDTSMLWDEYCLIRLSIQYRGRALPLVWRVIRHGSSSVSFEVYQAMLNRAARLVPAGVCVCFLADRGESGYSFNALFALWCCTGIFGFGSRAIVGFIEQARVGYSSTLITWHWAKWFYCRE